MNASAADPVRRDVVLLHGWGMTRTVWQGVRQGLPAAFRVLALDLPGYEAAPCCTPYTAERIAEELAAKAPKRCALVGWSLGAQVALHWARTCPEQVQRIALIAATPRFVAGTDWSHGMDTATFENFASALRSQPEETLARFALLQAHRDARARVVADNLREHVPRDLRHASRALEAGLALLRDTDFRQYLHAVRQPALLVHGEEDALVPLAAAQYLEAQLPDARLIALPGIGHAPLVAAPGTVANLITAFLHE